MARPLLLALCASAVVAGPARADGIAIVLSVSEDAYQGDAQFTVAVDGVPVGGIRTATASHAAGQTQAFTLPGFPSGPHTVSVDFLNDAWGGSPALDRNLYVDTISTGGATIRENREQYGNGTVDYVVAPPPAIAVSSQGAASITLQGTFTAAPGTLVDIFNGPIVVGMATIGQGGAWSYTGVLPAGSYALHATAIDPNGYATATAAGPAFTVASAGPAPSLAHPFAADSPWNTALGPKTLFEGDSGVLTTTLRTGAVPWIGPNSLGIYQASSNDPLATWTYQSSNGLGASGPGQVQIRTPASVQFLSGTDELAVIVSPDGTSYDETWLGAKGATPGSYTAAYLVANRIDGTGFSTSSNPAQGIRAAGSSILAGLVRAQELHDLDIPHAIAMVIATTQAAKGATQQAQFIFPATGADGNSVTAYSGAIPLGTRFAIPGTVDLSTIGLKTPEGLALARAYQLYGGFVVDTSPDTDVLASTETGTTPQQTNDLLADIGTIRAHLNAVVAIPAH